VTDTTETDIPGSSALKPWQRGGPTPNPLGRKRGTPNKFSRAFLVDVAEKWHTHGADVLEEVRRDDPSAGHRAVFRGPGRSALSRTPKLNGESPQPYEAALCYPSTVGLGVSL
jgi:hypothetical protein